MPVTALVYLFCFVSLVPCMAQQPRIPSIEAQRAALKKLEFMVGKWAGEARLLRGPGDPVALMQTEEAQYKLDGLILLIEGVGRNKTDGKPALQALGIVSYDDESGTYRMRATGTGASWNRRGRRGWRFRRMSGPHARPKRAMQPASHCYRD